MRKLMNGLTTQIDTQTVIYGVALLALVVTFSLTYLHAYGVI